MTKITMLLIVGNGGDFYQKWINHYQDCKDIDNLVVVNGYTQKWIDAGIERDLQNPTYNNDKTIIKVCDFLFSDKMQQQNEAMALVPTDTDYVWIADVDEFYNYNDIKYIKSELQKHNYTYVEFLMYHFWKRKKTIGYGGDGWAYDAPVARIFKFYNGAKFTSHRPITLLDENGVNMKEINPLLSIMNPVRTFHYAFIDSKLVREKMLYYKKVFGIDYYNTWYLPVFKKWTVDNRKEIEETLSVHPSCGGAKTIDIELNHPIELEAEKPNLIYYCSFGEMYAKMTNISIHTLLTKGNYTGDIIVIGDEHFKNDNKYNVKFIDVGVVYYDTTFARVFEANRIDANLYSQIMYLDCDIEVCSDISIMFDAKDGLLYANQKHKQSDFPFKGSSTSFCFTQEEFDLYKDNWLVNSGTFCIDAKLFTKLIEMWKYVISQHPLSWGVDQSSLNLIVYRGLLKQMPFKYESIKFLHDRFCPNETIGLNTVLFHYLGNTKQKMIDRYSDVFNGRIKGMVSHLMVINHMKFVDIAILQFCEQTYKNKELIIIADTDDIYEYILKEYIRKDDFNRIKLKRSESNSLGGKRNESIKLSKGEYLCIWDCDDIYATNKTEFMVSEMVSKGFNLCRIESVTMLDTEVNKKYISHKLTVGWGCIFMWKYSEDTHPEITGHEDYYLYEKLNLRYNCLVIDKPELYTYCWHGGNTVSYKHWHDIIEREI